MLPVKSKKISQYLNKIGRSLFEDDDSEDVFDLVITLDNTFLSFRDLSNFLTIVDHFYGRVFSKGFLSYSKTESAHLVADEVKQGSIEAIISDILSKLPLKQAVYFYLLIKHLPSAAKDLSEVTKNISETFYNYERASLVRQSRKPLKKKLRDDDMLKTLDDDEIAKLANNLHKRYNQETKLLNRATDFAEKKN